MSRQVKSTRVVKFYSACTYFQFSAKVQSHLSIFAKMAEGQDDPKKITITVKTPKEKQQVDIEEDADIRKLKETLGPRFGAEPEQLCLIFAGKIMNDADTLKQHNIKDGLTVHLVIKTPPRPEPEGGPRRPPADISATPFGLNSLGGLAGLESLGLGQSTFMDLQARMQQELLSNPDMLRQVLDNPLVQQMMNDPENMRTLITSNPQMQDLMARNPEISHMLNNPELLRQTMELARNPAMLQELMRSHDRALSNLESIPGGYNALQRMYRDIQEPMLNAASSMAGNPFSGLVDNSDGTNPQQGAENRRRRHPRGRAAGTPTAERGALLAVHAADGVSDGHQPEQLVAAARAAVLAAVRAAGGHGLPQQGGQPASSDSHIRRRERGRGEAPGAGAALHELTPRRPRDNTHTHLGRVYTGGGSPDAC